MSTAILSTLLFLVSAVAIYALWKLTRTTKVKTVDEEGAIFDLMHQVFGPGACEVAEMVTPHGRVMLVRCRGCKTQNRLRHGIDEARCGSCREPLSSANVCCTKCGKKNRLAAMTNMSTRERFDKDSVSVREMLLWLVDRLVFSVPEASPTNERLRTEHRAASW